MFKKAATAIANSYSMSDQANALTQQQKSPASIGGNDTYNDGGTFSPGQPLSPQHQGNSPWQYQFRVGQNLVTTPRAENGKLLPFQVLRNVAENHDITALCIQMMIDQVVGDEWDVVSANKNDRNNYEEDIQKVKDFFRKPDKVHLFNDWLKPILYDTLYGDCACLYKRRTRGGGLYSLEYVDGSTVKPLIDSYGRVPLAPYAAYQQIVYGYPYGSSDKDKTKTLGFTTDEISYRPRYPRAWTPYGFSPIEKILVKINIALRRDNYHLNYFTDGTTPDGGIYSFDKEDMSVDQIEQFSTLYNDIMSGQLKERLKLKFLPKGKYIDTKQFKYDVQVDEWIARIVAIGFGVNPQAFIMMMNRATGQLQDQQQTDIGLTPLENFFAEWFSDIIQNDLGYKHLKFKYVDEKKEDAQLSIQRDTEFVDRGIFTIDEVRSMRGAPPLTTLPGGVPPYVKVGNDVILFTEEYIKAKTDAQLQALQMGNVQGGNQQNTEVKLRQAQEEKSSDDKTQDTKQDKKDTKKAVQDELRQFEKFALRRLKKKTKNGRLFEANVIPEILCKSISDELNGANTPEEIRHIFKNVEDAEKLSNLVLQSADEVNNFFDDLQEYIEEQSDDISDEDLQDNDKKKTLLLLLLLGGYDFKTKIQQYFSDMLTRYAEQTATQAVSEIKSMGGNLTRSQLKEIVEEIVDKRIDFLQSEIERVTKEKISNDLENVVSKIDIIPVLENSYCLSDDRANDIADIEQRTIENMTRIEVAQKSGIVAAVLVSDGQEFDGPCVNADGQVWSLNYAGDNILEHPHCVRQFTYLTSEEVDSHGGIDEK